MFEVIVKQYGMVIAREVCWSGSEVDAYMARYQHSACHFEVRKI